MTCNIGTPYIRAPELVVVDIEGESTWKVLYDGERADSFSFGFLLYELLSREDLPRVRLPKMPSLEASRLEPPREDNSSIPLQIQDTGILLEGHPCAMVTLMNDCWSQLAHHRPRFTECLKRIAIVQSGEKALSAAKEKNGEEADEERGSGDVDRRRSSMRPQAGNAFNTIL
jgi:serine/threonine protein kinase